MEKYIVVMTTFSEEKVGKRIIENLISQKLAACIQSFQVDSYYFWKNEVNHDKETLLFIKTKKSLYKLVEKCILENHSYEVPEIIEVPITNGSSSYLKWIDEVCL